MSLSRHFSAAQWACLVGLLIVTLVLAGFVASHGLQLSGHHPLDWHIFWQLRVPLVITAISVGGALAVSAAMLQVLLRNPLADPGIIGISSGASLFAAIFLLAGQHLHWSMSNYGLSLFCFVGALLSTLLIYGLAKRLQRLDGSAVILAGIGLSTIAGAVIAWLYFFADAQAMRNLTFWIMGSLHQADLPLISLCAPPMLILMVYVCSRSRHFNWLYFDPVSAQLAGLDVVRFNRVILLICAILVGLAVSLAGSIAFVGLLVPHLLRQLFGHDNRFVLPASLLGGAALLLLVEAVSGQFGGVTLPVSMLTATIGGPVFIYALLRSQRSS